MRIWTVAEVATLFGVSEMTVYRWAHAGHLPRLNLPNSMMRFRDSDVMRLLAVERQE
jgi:excisionase family DNA binding protein